MARGVRRKLSFRQFLSGGRSRILIIMVILFVIIDGALIWYTVSYSVADKDLDERSVNDEILQLEASKSGLVAVRTSGTVQLLEESPIHLQFSGTPLDMTMGDDSSAMAVVTDDGKIHYFSPGSTVETKTLQVNGSYALVGIFEEYSATVYRPRSIIALVSNGTSYGAVSLSIDEGTVLWSLSFDAEITGHARSDNTGYFSLIVGTDQIFHFAQFSPDPRMIYTFDAPLDEIQNARSGTGIVALFDEGSRLSAFSITSSDPTWTAELPAGSIDLKLRNQMEYAYVRSEDRVLVIEQGTVSTRIETEGLSAYTVPSVSDKLFLSTGKEMEGYKGQRSAPNWIAGTDVDVEEMSTDVGGSLIIGWGNQDIFLIDDHRTPVGNDGLWTFLGFLIIGQFGLVVIYGLWDRISTTGIEALYLIVAGAIGGVVVAYILPDITAIDWYGTAAYATLAGMISALSALISWRMDAGLASVVVGVVAGIVLAIPLSLVAHFLMMVGGYQFPDSPFFSVANLLFTGLKMGVVGGVIGYAAQWLIEENVGKR
jgi:hypothetical protein